MITAVTCLWPPVPGSRSVQTSEKTRVPATMHYSRNSLSWSLEQDNLSQTEMCHKSNDNHHLCSLSKYYNIKDSGYSVNFLHTVFVK